MSDSRVTAFKRSIRRPILVRRRQIGKIDRARYSRLVCDRVSMLPEFRLAKSVALYMAMPDEVDVDALRVRALSEGKQIGLPAWHAQRHVYGLQSVGSVDRIKIGRFGIREPIKGDWLPAKAFDLILVPGVAFDRRGARIGMGGGWYDRLLADSCHAVHVGIAFDFQLVSSLPGTVLDVPMNLIVTPSAVVRCRGVNRRIRINQSLGRLYGSYQCNH